MIEQRITDLGYKLPEPSAAPENFLTVSIYEGIAYVSGTLPYVAGKIPREGKVGYTVSLEEGKKLAEISILNLLANLKKEIGSLDKVKQIIKIIGYVASATGFTKQGEVMNAASNLLLDIFEEKGKHARSAVGTLVMPKNSPVEIEMIVAIEK